MSSVKGIFIEFDNLTEDEQLRLFLNLFHFADKELPRMKELKLGIVKKK